VLTFADFAGQSEADIEDMFGEALYLDLVTAASCFAGFNSGSIIMYRRLLHLVDAMCLSLAATNINAERPSMSPGPASPIGTQHFSYELW
jgi:hypothetical protein